jgi:hypothetical protein
MKLTSGEIYFIGEIDLKTGERTEYVKLGIVRDGGKDRRDSIDRLMEHQTGNPRRLELLHTIRTNAVEGIETNLHLSFARHRVYGEWLRLGAQLLPKVISRAEELCEQIEGYKSIFEEAEELGDKISRREKMNPDSNAEYWFHRYHDFKVQISACQQVIEQYKEIRIKQRRAGASVEAYLDARVRSGHIYFDELAFKRDYPDLFTQYSKKTRSEIPKGSFRVNNRKDNFKALSELNPQLQTSIEEFKKDLAKLEQGQVEGEVHNKFLDLTSYQAHAKWELDLSVINLKVVCGTFDGISGICSWKRAFSEFQVLDIARLATDSPEIHGRYLRKSEKKQVYSLEKMSAYPDFTEG